MTNLSGKLLTIAHVDLPPSMNAAARSLRKCTTSRDLFKATIKSIVSAEYSTLVSTFFKSAGPLSLSQIYYSPARPLA